MFKALLITQDQGRHACAVTEMDDSPWAQLADGEVLLQVQYSTLNYKDGLAITGQAPVVRRFPMVPGIDMAATVVRSQHARWLPGDQVVLNGWGVGESHWGGLAQMACVHGDWLVRLPAALSPWEAMALGTAGYTAMLCVQALEKHWADQGVGPSAGEVLVTGATGGVGSVATLLLAQRGYRVVAATGKAHEAAYLQHLGAHEVIDRATLSAPGKPLQKERWLGVVDTVGSHTLANACATTRYAGAVAACGLAQGMDFPASVAPFILRGVTLYGIDSVMAPLSKREAAWTRLASDVDRQKLAGLVREITLAEAVPWASELLAGRVAGRVVVDVNA